MTGHEQLPPDRADDETDDVARKVNDVLSAFFRDSQGAMLMKWTLQAEVIDPDGQSAMWTLSSEGMAIWERQAFTRYAMKYYDFLQEYANRGGED